MKPHLLTHCAPLLLLLLFSGCKGSDSPAPSTSETSDPPPSNRIDIPSTVRNNLDMTFASVERRNLSNTLRVPGAFELQPLAQHEYRLLLPGVIHYRVNQFDEVSPGQALYHLQSTEWLRMQKEISAASATLEQVRTKYEAVNDRVKALQKADFKRADLEENLADLSADLVMQEAIYHQAVRHAARILNLCHAFGTDHLTPDELLAPTHFNGKTVPFYQTIERIEVLAIKPGVVESLAATDGGYLAESTLLLTTVDPTKIRFRASGLQSDLPKFQLHQHVRIVPPQTHHSDINASVDADFVIGLAADPQRRTLDLYGTPKEHKPWIKPGLSAFMEITTQSTSGPVLAIPRSALVKDGLTYVFFKRDPQNPNKAIRVEADLGIDDGRWVEVKSDIGPADQVALNGAYELKLATATSGTAQKGGHFHADGTYHGEH